ncbi:hypothetical protein [Kordia sp. SMS9]|uniref:hypothetical protein n=1 Tax=Kordia sp. SMS9 TaxID=2282170 RepID=UPI0019657C6C|nr:hypothetical protein [Kordia sp. SMS9]
MIALEEALVPSAGLIDGRTETDNLRLLADFASLFNFYDRTNTINGNWAPFLLKDPVFLVASIAKTAFQKAYSLFINICLQLEIALQEDIHTTYISNGFNQLFDQLSAVFQTVEQWTSYMQQSTLDYNLKTYIIQQVKQQQSALLWAILALRTDLNLNKIVPNIQPVDTYLYENYDQKIWKDSKGKTPYWTLLNLKFSPENEYVYYFFKDFATLVNELLQFLKGKLPSTPQEISATVKAAFTELKKALNTLFSNASAIIDKVITFKKGAAKVVYKIVEAIIAELKKLTANTTEKDASDAIENLLNDIKDFQDTLTAITVNLTPENFQQLIDKALYYLEAIISTIVSILETFGEWFLTILKRVFETLVKDIVKIEKELYKLLKEIIAYILTKQVRLDIFNGLKGTGKTVFGFYSKCISYADTELITLQQKPGHFPDTMLLRTFTSLLKIYQKQFNSLATKHLNFYYDDILKQSPNSVSPDMVFASSELAKKTATFQLEKNTLFSAGINADKQPILFEATQKTSFNPAKIVNAYTLAKTNNTGSIQLYLEKLPPVNMVTKGETGAIETWKTFGSAQTPVGTQQELAFTIASPMFYLEEATKRTLLLTFTFSKSKEIDFSQPDFTFYLSTEKAWFEVPAAGNISTDSNKNQLQLQLNATDPAIKAFTKNPDGYTSEWPLLKIVFPNYDDTYSKLAIATLNIDVTVNELQNFQLYNDFGQLNPKKPFQLLGGAPKVNQHFMVGNAEIFSKPATDISFTLTWNPFAADFDFENYYQAYNQYLNGAYSSELSQVDMLIAALEKITQLQNSFYQGVTSSEDNLFANILNKNTVSDAVQLIKTNVADLTSTVQNQNTKLAKNIKAVSTLIVAIQTLNTQMSSSITTTLQTLSSTITTAGKVDATTVNTAKTTITNEINTTKTTITEKINAFETSALTPKGKEKKTFFSQLKNIFGTDNETDTATETPPAITNYFSNDSFYVDFQQLQHSIWESFYYTINTNTFSSAIEENLFFEDTTNLKTIPVSRTFDFAGIDLNPANVDATLQQKILQLTDKTEAGFLRMKLTEPTYGFGTELYPKVVQAIALFNADIIAEKINNSGAENPLVSPPNIPFVPMVSAFQGSYAASVSYDFSTNKQNYPLQCFYNTPFANYKVYDTTLDERIIAENIIIGTLPTKKTERLITPLTALPILPKFSSKGQLFIELQDLIMPAEVSFYVELARTYTEKILEKKSIQYSYLSTDGWKAFADTDIADDTDHFTCSGIITINIPADITTVHDTMSGSNYWIAIGTIDNLDSFPETSYLNTNGFTLQRVVAADDFSTEIPQILPNVITSPQTAIPEIAATVQPFASFGGKAAETNMQMNARVSTRLKTKDRLVTMDDFYNTIRLEFPEVYYSKTIYKKSQKQAFTHVIKRVADATETNAFQPLLSECKELEIQQYIAARVSPFLTVSVENFELHYVKITAEIQVQPGEDITSVTKEVNNGINIFLAPWITSAQEQITIDTGLTTAQLAAFINSYDSILEVTSISFLVGTKNFDTGAIEYRKNEKPKQEIAQKDGILLVPSLNNMTKNSTITYN